MLKSLTFWTLVLFINTAWAAGPNCGALLGADQLSSNNLPFHSLRRIDPQPWDVAEHGFIVKRNDFTGLEAVQKTLAERDGTYPLIIDENNNLVIDHRLPESAFADLNAEAYVGNHLGLYNRLKKENKGAEPKVVFAGQIRLVAGKVKNLIDQSGSFYFTAEDLGFTGTNKNDRLIAHNQARLENALDLLTELQITDETTEVKNFVESYMGYENPADRREGHVLAKDAAKFERFCRATPSCWSKHQSIENMMRKLSAIGTKAEFSKYLLSGLKENPAGIFEAVQIWAMVLTEGATELLSNPKALDSKTEKGAMIDRFIEGLDQIDLNGFKKFVLDFRAL
jgi:hypothetical protein